ncbi:MAG: membrane protein insertion efficiency factor YidD [Bacteroidales bacterium]|nr:membrane protein insertion efficiency factor YidD [Bacteroidales bacterium]
MKFRYIAFILITCLPFISKGQRFTTDSLHCVHLDIFNNDDLLLLQQQEPADSLFKDRNIKYGFGNSVNTVNPFYHLLASSMFIYQKYVSPALSRQCAYIPSCSAFSKQLITEYGLLKGSFYTADRLMRCNRIALADKNNIFLLLEGNGNISESPLRYKLFNAPDKETKVSLVQTSDTIHESNSVDNESNNAKKDWDFTMYLIGNGMKEDALTIVSNMNNTSDSIRFLKGYTYYTYHFLEKSINMFDSVSNHSDLFNESKFFSSISAAHLYRLDKAENDLHQIISEENLINDLKNFELAGISLLQHDNDKFNYYINLTDSNNFNISEEVRLLKNINHEINSYKKKSAWIAGGLSAVIPGLGKVYAGNTGEGISSFLICGSLIGITAENLYHNGLSNWKTVLFGTVSSVFYIGNILGSAVSVNINYDNFNQRNNVKILYNIHIPIRNFFRH